MSNEAKETLANLIRAYGELRDLPDRWSRLSSAERHVMRAQVELMREISTTVKAELEMVAV